MDSINPLNILKHYQKCGSKEVNHIGNFPWRESFSRFSMGVASRYGSPRVATGWERSECCELTHNFLGNQRSRKPGPMVLLATGSLIWQPWLVRRQQDWGVTFRSLCNLVDDEEWILTELVRAPRGQVRHWSSLISLDSSIFESPATVAFRTNQKWRRKYIPPGHGRRAIRKTCLINYVILISFRKVRNLSTIKSIHMAINYVFLMV